MIIKKRFLPLLTLILCTVLAFSIPITTVAASSAITSYETFGFAEFFSAEYSISLSGGSGSATATADTISITAAGTGSGCDAAGSTTTVTLTAKEAVSVTCTVKDSAQLVPPGEVTNNTDGSQTFIVGAGSTVSFTVYSGNSGTKSGSVVFSAVEPAESKIPADCAVYSYNGNFYPYLDNAIEAATSRCYCIICGCILC